MFEQANKGWSAQEREVSARAFERAALGFDEAPEALIAVSDIAPLLRMLAELIRSGAIESPTDLEQLKGITNV